MDEQSNGGAAAPESGGASAPLTIAETASNVIDQYDQSADAATGGAPPAEAPTTEQPTDEQLAEEEQILREFRYSTQFKPDGREHHIPRSKVLKMIAAGLSRGTEKWTGEKTTLQEELDGLRGFRDRFAQALQGDERAFIQEIANHDPRYRRFLADAVEARQAEAHAPSDEPQPDIDLGNGQSTFSKVGLQKWVDWAVGQRLAPMEQARKLEEDRAKEFQAQEQLRSTVRGQVETAKQWPQWDEYADDILKKLRADSAEARKARRRPQMTLREAYLETKAERLSGSANDTRKQVIEDLKHAPRSTALRANAEVPRSTAPRSIRDIAARTIDRLERQGS